MLRYPGVCRSAEGVEWASLLIQGLVYALILGIKGHQKDPTYSILPHPPQCCPQLIPEDEWIQLLGQGTVMGTQGRATLIPVCEKKGESSLNRCS